MAEISGSGASSTVVHSSREVTWYSQGRKTNKQPKNENKVKDLSKQKNEEFKGRKDEGNVSSLFQRFSMLFSSLLTRSHDVSDIGSENEESKGRKDEENVSSLSRRFSMHYSSLLTRSHDDSDIGSRLLSSPLLRRDEGILRVTLSRQFADVDDDDQGATMAFIVGAIGGVLGWYKGGHSIEGASIGILAGMLSHVMAPAPDTRTAAGGLALGCTLGYLKLRSPSQSSLTFDIALIANAIFIYYLRKKHH